MLLNSADPNWSLRVSVIIEIKYSIAAFFSYFVDLNISKLCYYNISTNKLRRCNRIYIHIFRYHRVITNTQLTIYVAW